MNLVPFGTGGPQPGIAPSLNLECGVTIMNWTNAAAAAVASEVEIEDTSRRGLGKTVPVRLVEIAARVFTLDWLQPDGARVYQVVDFRGDQVQAYMELSAPEEDR